MTRFTERVERDLAQIADRATPSSTAWEAIQQRIDEQDTTRTSEPTMEVIMLAPDRTHPPARSRTWIIAAAAAAVLALIGGLIVASTRSGEDPVPADEPEPVLPEVESVATFPTNDGPFAVVSDGTSIWITNINEVTDSVSKLNPDDGTRVDYPTADDPGRVGTNPRAVAFDGSDIWVANNNGTVSKIDPDDGTRVEYPTSSLAGVSPLGMVFDGTSVWITNLAEDTVSKMRPDDGTRVDYATGVGPASLAFDGTSIWVVNNGDDTVSKMNPDDGTRVDYATGGLPIGVAFDGANIWISNSDDDTVSKMNPDDGTRVDYATGDEPFGVAFDGAHIWVTNAGDGTVSKMSPDGARVDVPVGNIPRGVTFDGTYIWVVNNRDNTVSRIDPRGVAPALPADGADASPPPTEEQLTAMAVIGVDAADEVVLRSEPSATADVVTTISAFDTTVRVSFVESARIGDEEWVRIGRVGSLAVDGWTLSTNLTPIEGGEEQPQSFLEYVSMVRAALGGADPAAGLAALTSGLQVSTDVAFSDDDVAITAADLADGSASDLLTEITASTSIEQTQRISVNRRNRANTGDTIENIVEIYPDALVVDLHYIGDPDDRPGTWTSTLLVIQPDEAGGATNPWRLVGIAQDGSTG